MTPSVLVLAAATTVLVRARPWSALVTRVPVPWLQELALCAWCLGFWVGVLAGLVTYPGTLRGLLHAAALGFQVSLAAGMVTAAARLLDRAGDALELWISKELK